MKTTTETLRGIQRHTRRRFSSEEKFRIVIDGLQGEESKAELCRREEISPNLYYNWSKDFLEAGKRRFNGDTKREANSSEVKALCKVNEQLKYVVGEIALDLRKYQKKIG